MDFRSYVCINPFIQFISPIMQGQPLYTILFMIYKEVLLVHTFFVFILK